MKVIVIGIDGGTFDLILPWINEGKLPNFKRLVKGGSWGHLDCGPLAFTAVSWSSFITGCNPGKHGVSDFYMIRKNKERNDPVHFSIEDRYQHSLWSVISKQQKKVAVFNVPLTYPPENINGVLVSGFQTPPNITNYTYPTSVKKKLDELAQGYSIYAKSVSPETNYEKYLEASFQVTDKQFKAVEYFLRKGDWDFFMYVFQQTDFLQHSYWHFMDNTHPQYTKDERFRNAIISIYQKVDGYLGSILDNLDSDTALIVMSDHGAGPVYNRFWLNNWLMKEGYLKLKNNFRGLLSRVSIKLNVCEADFFNFLIKDSFIGKIRSRLTGRDVERKNRFFYKFKDIDWSKTKAYCIAYNQLSVNLKGREPEGIVSEGFEYENLRDELIDRLKRVISPVTKKTMITEIYKKEELFSGPLLGTLPDIVYVCDNFKTLSLGGYKIGSAKIMDKPSPRTADHRREGIVMLYGSAFKAHHRIEKASMVDLAPTILSLLGLKIPSYMDGSIMKTCFAKPSSITEEFVDYQIQAEKNKEQIYTKQDVEQIEDKLRSLGYLG